MVVICRENKSECEPLVLPRDVQCPLSEENFISSSEWYTLDGTLSGYCISKEKEYTVYGIIVYGLQIRYLIFDDNNIPGFFPSDLFSIDNPSVSFDWEINKFYVGSKSLLVIGCPELCESYINLVGLINCSSQCIEKLLLYKDCIASYNQ